MHPKVWICLPTYNGDPFLEAAILSALAQDYPNFEILISDDGSSDRTPELIEQLIAKAIVPVTYLSHERLGLVENWNFCVQYCLTLDQPPQYLKFLCQDDLLEPECLSEMVAAAILDPQIGMVFSRRKVMAQKYDQNYTWLENLSGYWDNLQSLQPGLDLFSDRHFLQPPDNKIGEPTNVLISAEVFSKIGDFDPDFRQFCDLEMWLRIMAHYKVAFSDRCLASFRLHDQQASNANRQQDLVWAEIYRLWLKILRHPIYAIVPPGVKAKIYRHFLNQAMREYLRIIRRQKWHRLGQLTHLLRSLIIP